MSDFLNYEQEGHIVTLTMNDPERRNPLTGNSASAEFLAAIDRIQADHSVRAVILTGAGTAFSSGGNVRDMGRYSDMPAMELRREYRLGIQKVALNLFNLEVPVIAAVNGHAIGAGLDLACLCDIRIAAEGAKFAESFVKLGIIPGDGGAWLLPRIIGLSRATELTLTGQTIDAKQAAEWNLVSRVVPLDQLMPMARELAGQIAVQSAARRAHGQAPVARSASFTPGHAARNVGRLPGDVAPDAGSSRGGRGIQSRSASRSFEADAE